MVLWCKGCSRLIGFMEPFADWSVDSRAVCPDCFKLLERSPVLDVAGPVAEQRPHHPMLQQRKEEIVTSQETGAS